MKKSIKSSLSLLLVFFMLLSVLVACGDEEDTTQAKGSDTTEGESTSELESNSTDTEQTEESESDSKTETETEAPIVLEGAEGPLIQLADKLANGANTYYTDGSQQTVITENNNMSLSYNMNNVIQNMQVTSLANKMGENYLQNTMDVFVKMKNGNTYYASSSVSKAALNIYRFGYYYYENRIEGQSFVNEIGRSEEYELRHMTYGKYNDISKPERDKDTQTLSFKTEGGDPYMIYEAGLSADKYDYIEITIRVGYETASAQLFVMAGSHTYFTEGQSYRFSLINDGEFHSYQIPMNAIADYSGTIKQLRLDINAAKGSAVEIRGIKAFKSDTKGAPVGLSLQRSFLTYSDKLHHIAQISAANTTSDIAEIGMLTEIAADTVAKLIIKDKTGLHESIEGVDMDSVEYVAFDIKNAGIFGYILPCDDASGKLSVTLTDGKYQIVQTKIPKNGTIQASQKGTRNANDFFMGQRIYTDATHSFEKFLHEAECERNPLAKESFAIHSESSDNASFAGYDALRGYYKFTLSGTDFNKAYFQYSNKHYAVNFTVKGDDLNRQMYFMTYTSSGNLESAVLLNQEEMLLPVPLEVAKNFNGDGENTIYNLDDASYGEVYFPMVVKSGEEKTYTLLNLYQNWGQYPLKQISSIQFFSPYYHLSTGVTETNCIVPLTPQGPRLPDHRAMSAPLWPGQPQHTSGGEHIFLSYKDADGNFSSTENTYQSIDSYGPTYADVTMGYIGSDGKISATYTHTEMPQTDENRGYYEMIYTFNEDISFKNFGHDVTLYHVGKNYPTGNYTKVGYLDENNKSQVVKAEQGSSVKEYVLGTECPYFSFFDMPDYDPDYLNKQGYVNLSLLVYNYEVIQNGKKIDANFLLRNVNSRIYLSLDLGEIDFKKGDTIKINCILLPWGSQESDYSGSEPDKNVREVRRNTLLNPLKAEANADCQVLDSVFVPKLQTTNGKSAEFTLSGGENNVTVRIYGFEKLTAPKIEEYVDGKWVEYVVSSLNSPDAYDNAHAYDGYMVHYDGDGTYSYSFVTTMKDGGARKFRIFADKDFEKWPEKEEITLPDPINVYFDAKEIFLTSMSNSLISRSEKAEDGSYTRFYGKTGIPESYFVPFTATANPNVTSTGQYFVVKYRMPAGISSLGTFEFFLSSSNSGPAAGDNIVVSPVHQDGEWHVLIIDAAAKGKLTAASDGSYLAKYFRMDYFNGQVSEQMYIDFAYIGMGDDLDKILEINSDMDQVILVDGSGNHMIDPKTGEAIQ